MLSNPPNTFVGISILYKLTLYRKKESWELLDVFSLKIVFFSSFFFNLKNKAASIREVTDKAFLAP